MNTKGYLIVSTVLFALIAIVHLIRLTLGWQAEIGTWMVPLWASLVAVVVCGGFAAWGMSLMRRMGH